MTIAATAFKDYEDNDNKEDSLYQKVIGFFNSKNLDIEYIARAAIEIHDVNKVKTKRVFVIIMRLDEFGKLSEHCPEFISFVRFSVTKTYKQKIMSAVVIKGGGHIKKMIDLFKSMEPYNHELQIKLKKYDDTIKKADDTIKQLRLDLKEFRSMRRNINKKMKKNLEKPPEYEDERPPGF
jgi:hypothetical protein